MSPVSHCLFFPWPQNDEDGRKYEAFMIAVEPFMRECETCGGSGEYETEYGPRGCGLCNSRLVPVRTQSGESIDMDYGDIAVIDDGRLVDVIRRLS